MTALHYAVQNPSDSAHGIVSLLLDRGANTEVVDKVSSGAFLVVLANA